MFRSLLSGRLKAMRTCMPTRDVRQWHASVACTVHPVYPRPAHVPLPTAAVIRKGRGLCREDEMQDTLLLLKSCGQYGKNKQVLGCKT